VHLDRLVSKAPLDNPVTPDFQVTQDQLEAPDQLVHLARRDLRDSLVQVGRQDRLGLRVSQDQRVLRDLPEQSDHSDQLVMQE
jgi:hypothetical protein